ncbi:hypothetical protein WBG78_26540 [Chryseolinea sp. T2]|uniref:hypothetical protein n=1 Tax=Chryseolinea sp. T2 TaxID=3129255 RepID=UPI003077C261
MDVEKFWIYVVLAAIYGLSRLLKKDPKKPASTPRNNPRETVAPRRREFPDRTPATRTLADTVNRPEPQKQQPKAMTFEELMREIMEAKTTPPKQEPVVDYDDQIGEEERDLEDVNYDNRKDSEVIETYERARKEAFSRPSLEETMKVGDTVVSFGKFKEFEKTSGSNLAEEYLNDFGDMDKVRKAVVMSEILKPKF